MAEDLVKLEGFAELEQTLDKLPREIAQPIFRAGLRAAGKAMAAEIETRARAVSEVLGDSVKVQISKDRKAGQLVARVATRGRRAFFSHLVEFGTAPHRIPSASGFLFIGGRGENAVVPAPVDHPGHAAKPFFRPGIAAGKRPALSKMSSELKKRIDRAVRKLNRGPK